MIKRGVHTLSVRWIMPMQRCGRLEAGRELCLGLMLSAWCAPIVRCGRVSTSGRVGKMISFPVEVVEIVRISYLFC